MLYDNGQMECKSLLKVWRSSKILFPSRFRLAACQIQELEGCRDLNALQRCLKSLPRTLEETYNRSLSRIPRELFEGAILILQFLIHSDQTLLVEDAIDLVSFGPATSTVELDKRMPDPKWIATYCRSLVTFHDTGPKSTVSFLDKEIRLAHFTVEEFLISNNVDQKFRSYFEEENARKSLFEVSIARIERLSSFECGTSGCDRQHPFANYAATYLMMHARMFDQKDETFEHLWNFLTNSRAYEFWLWHAVERKFNEKMVTASQIFIAAHLGLLRSLQRFLEKGFCFVSQPVKASGDAPIGFYMKKRSSSDSPDSSHEKEKFYPITPLYAASAHGHRTIVRELLKHSAPVNDIGGSLGTALVAACHQGHHEVVDEILRAVPDTMAFDYHDSLQAAAENGHLDTVQMLVLHGVPPGHAADQYGSAIYAASVGGDSSIVRYLLNESGDTPNIQGPPCSDMSYFKCQKSNERSFSGIRRRVRHENCRICKDIFGNALQAASGLGHCDIVRMLLDKGLSPNIIAGFYGSALQAAAAANYAEIVDILLRENADVNIRGGHYGSAVQAALVEGYPEVMGKLLQGGAKPPLDIKFLDHTWVFGDESLVTLVIKRMAESDEFVEANSSLGLFLSSESHLQSAKESIVFSPAGTLERTSSRFPFQNVKPCLFKRKVTPAPAQRPSKFERGSISPFYRALNRDWRLLGQELVKQGTEVTLRDAGGRNLLHHAARKLSAEESCAWVDILAHGTSARLALFQSDKDGRTPLHLAVLNGYHQVVEKLMDILQTPRERIVSEQKAKDLLVLKCRGQSALHIAIEQRNDKIMRILLQVAQSLEFVQDLLLDEDYAGRTPVWIAAHCLLPKATKTLIAFGADLGIPNKYGKSALDRMKQMSTLQPFPLGVRLPGTCTGSWSEEILSLISAVRLHHAAETNDLSLSEEVIRAETRCQDIINSIDIDTGKTPLHWATQNGSSRLVNLLLQPGWKADTDINDNAGNTPLHYAVLKAHLEISRILVGQGASLKIANSEGQTPLDLAKRQQDNVLMELVSDLENDNFIGSSTDEGSFNPFSDSHDTGGNKDHDDNDEELICWHNQENRKRSIDGGPGEPENDFERNAKRQRNHD